MTRSCSPSGTASTLVCVYWFNDDPVQARGARQHVRRQPPGVQGGPGGAGGEGGGWDGGGADCGVQVLVEEQLADNAERMGELLRGELGQLPGSVVTLVRGRGLLNAIQVGCL